MNIPEVTKSLCQSKLGVLFNNFNDIEGALVSTLDGQLLASQQKGNDSLERVAVMGGSLVSLTDTMIAELNLGHNENVISQNENGILAFMHINPQLVLVSFTRNKLALGLLLAHCNRCCEALKHIHV